MNRVEHHIILGDSAGDRRTVPIRVDGETIEAYDGEMIAAALVASGRYFFRYTEGRREPRGVFCGIGRCTDCVMIVNGIPNVRTCVTPVREGMVVETQHGAGQWPGMDQ